MLKQYIVRKYVKAENVAQSLRLEKNIKADEAWIDTDWKADKDISVGFKYVKTSERISSFRKI